MKFEKIARSHGFQLFTLYILAIFTGWSVFNLQVVSIVRLLQEAGIESLPGLMVLQAICSFFLLRAWGNAAMGSSRKFFTTALVLGAAVAVGAQLQGSNGTVKGDWKIFAVFYIASQLCIAALRMGIHLTFAKRISLLRNPQLSTQLSIAEESGIMLGILLLILQQKTLLFNWQIQAVMAGLPFIFSLAIFAFIQTSYAPQKKIFADIHILNKLREVSNYFKPLLKITSPTSSTRLAPFTPWMIGLFTIVACLKGMQWFGMAYGLAEASRQGNAAVVSIFSKMAIIQSSMTLAILWASLKFASRIPTWGVGFRVLLFFQALTGSVLTFFPLPYFLMGGEVTRKVLEHGFLGRSLQLLTSSLPDDQRLEMRHLMERWSTTSGTAIAGICAWFVIRGFSPINLMGLLIVALCFFGMQLRRKLFNNLNDFHLAQLGQERLTSVIQACYVLGNPECKKHHAALTALLDRQPRPVITKSLLYALGRMQNAKAIPVISKFMFSDREDIQLAAVRALGEYNGHEINLLLLKTLRSTIRSELAIRISVVRFLTQKLKRLAVPYLLEVFEDSTDERITANTVEILGEIALAEKDDDLMSYLTKFLEKTYPRRVRGNAIVTLYNHKHFGTTALEVFDQYLTSTDDKELDAAAYIAGILGLSGYESFIWKRSDECGHSNSILLVSLLRLQNPRAAALLAGWIVSDDEKRAVAALVRLSAVPTDRRAKVFYELIEEHPHLLDLALLRMRKSQRDFDADRDLIREEARRLNIPVTEEQAWLTSSPSASKEDQAA